MDGAINSNIARVLGLLFAFGGGEARELHSAFLFVEGGIVIEAIVIQTILPFLIVLAFLARRPVDGKRRHCTTKFTAAESTQARAAASSAGRLFADRMLLAFEISSGHDGVGLGDVATWNL